MIASRKQRWVVPWLRALVVAIAIPLASSGSLPLWAQLVGVEGVHVCRCAADRHDCACARCHPDHADELRGTTESLSGRCGDDEIAFGGESLCAVLTAPAIASPIVVRQGAWSFVSEPRADAVRAPPTPPPRRPSSLA